jgi:hypothetical protein
MMQPTGCWKLHHIDLAACWTVFRKSWLRTTSGNQTGNRTPRKGDEATWHLADAGDPAERLLQPNQLARIFPTHKDYGCGSMHVGLWYTR